MSASSSTVIGRSITRIWRKAVNNKTKLIAISLVSSNNGHLEDVKTLSELAHAHGAYLFADIIQGCGATPIDVKAMGIDFASCGMYKWLQGEHGFGFLYVKEDLQGSVVKGTQFTGHAGLNYQPWTESPDPAKPEFVYHPRKGISQFECSTPAVINYAGQYESFNFIEKLGVDNIRAHARELTDRLQNELPSERYTSITPKGTEAAIVVFPVQGHRGHPQPDSAGERRRPGQHLDRRPQLGPHRRTQRQSDALLGLGLQQPRRHRPHFGGVVVTAGHALPCRAVTVRERSVTGRDKRDR